MTNYLWAAAHEARAERREASRARRRLIIELAAFTSVADRAELAGLLERPNEDLDEVTSGLIGDQIVGGTHLATFAA